VSTARVDIRTAALSIDEAVRAVAHDGAGATVTFVGTVRDVNDGRAVSLLEYEAYATMARAEMARICSEVELAWPGTRAAAFHRTGALSVGDAAVVCAVSAPHRGDAFRACRKVIDEIKLRVPIWKREHGPDGPYWVGWEDARCTADDGHESEHDHATRASHDP
jgi:molybdopterin synthase catalytic subunit